jgi:hypothetical protein
VEEFNKTQAGYSAFEVTTDRYGDADGWTFYLTMPAEADQRRPELTGRNPHKPTLDDFTAQIEGASEEDKHRQAAVIVEAASGEPKSVWKIRQAKPAGMSSETARQVIIRMHDAKILDTGGDAVNIHPDAPNWARALWKLSSQEWN